MIRNFQGLVWLMQDKVLHGLNQWSHYYPVAVNQTFPKDASLPPGANCDLKPVDRVVEIKRYPYSVEVEAVRSPFKP